MRSILIQDALNEQSLLNMVILNFIIRDNVNFLMHQFMLFSNSTYKNVFRKCMAFYIPTIELSWTWNENGEEYIWLVFDENVHMSIRFILQNHLSFVQKSSFYSDTDLFDFLNIQIWYLTDVKMVENHSIIVSLCTTKSLDGLHILCAKTFCMKNSIYVMNWSNACLKL